MKTLYTVYCDYVLQALTAHSFRKRYVQPCIMHNMLVLNMNVPVISNMKVNQLAYFCATRNFFGSELENYLVAYVMLRIDNK